MVLIPHMKLYRWDYGDMFYIIPVNKYFMYNLKMAIIKRRNI